jgi:glycosyltransferase involved in cell wall biosynthesis
VLGGFESPAFERQLRDAAEGLPVVFHGAFGPPQLRAARPHAGVFPSTCLETYGIVLDECFELGLPCIVSDLGAIGERAGGAGLHVPAGDAAALASAMLRLCDEDGLWQRLAAAVPGLPPSLDAHVQALAQIYEAALQRPAPPPFAPPVPLQRRLDLLLMQRESALAKLAPDGPEG